MIENSILKLINECKHQEAIAVLNKTMYSKIRNYILKNSGDIESVKEIYQESIIILFEKIRKKEFDVTKDVEAFMFTVAKNKWISMVRKKQINQRYFDRRLDVEAYDSENGYEILLKKEIRQEMQFVFEKLSQNCQKIIELATFEGFSMDEIALKLDFRNRDTAKTAHYKCKKRLKELILNSVKLKELYTEL